MKVCTGDEVKWKSLIEDSSHVFKGKVKKTLGNFAVIDDRSGLTFRCVAMSRLELLGGPRRRHFAGTSA